METVGDFIFLGSKITVDGDCSHEIKRRLLLGRGGSDRGGTNYDKTRQHIKKQRHYFTNKGPIIVKTMAFPVVVYGSESWIIKKAEHRRTDAFTLCC